MIRIYTAPSCSSCRKAKKWLDDHNVKYVEKNIFAIPLTKDDIKLMLKNSENGFEDIISDRSKYIMEHPIDYDKITVSELTQLIIDNPSVLKRPIICDESKMTVGYNDDEIRVFIPDELRKAMMCTSCDGHEIKDAIKKFYYEQVNIKK